MTPRELVNKALADKLHERFAAAQVKSRPMLQAHAPDLAQEAALGIITASERFNPARGVAFETFAWWWMKHSTFHYLSRMFGATRRRIPETSFSLDDEECAYEAVAPCEIEAAHARLDAPKVWAQTKAKLSELPDRAGTHRTENAKRERADAADVFLRNTFRGESLRELAIEAGTTFQRAGQKVEKMRGEFQRLFPHAVLS